MNVNVLEHIVEGFSDLDLHQVENQVDTGIRNKLKNLSL